MALLGGCEIGSTTIPLSEPQVVVHAILNPSLSVQTFLLEESLTGKRSQTTVFDPNNPITLTGGIPISGAVIQLTGPEGLRTAAEIRSNGRPTGIYQVDGTVQPGARYTVSIAAIGHTVTGSTQVPRATLAPAPQFVVPFNRDHESLEFPIQNVELARAYWVRVEAAFSAFELFTTDSEVSISGDTRNFFTDDLLRLFFPGFQQMVTVAAIDTNVYDYYRSGNDPFSGVGLISHLTGGIGLFGSMAVVERRILDVAQDPTGDPIEDVFTLRGGAPDDVLPQRLQFYLESKAATSTAEDRLSGAYVRNPGLAQESGSFVGTRKGQVIDISIFAPKSTTDVFYHVVGTFAGDTLRMPFNKSTAIFVRQGR